MKYKYLTDRFTGQNDTDYISRINDDGTTTFIPCDEENSDYKSYKLWLSEGNTPDSAD